VRNAKLDAPANCRGVGGGKKAAEGGGKRGGRRDEDEYSIVTCDV